MTVFKSYLNRKKALPSNPGRAIIEWDYLNENNEVVHEKKDFDAMIQSFAKVTDYKEMIERYGFDDEYTSRASRAVYADVSNFAEMDYADCSKYIDNLVKELNTAVAVANAKKVEKPIEKGEEAATESAEAATESRKGGQQQ